MRRVVNLIKALAVSGIVILIPLGILWGFKDETVGAFLFVGVGFTILLVLQVLLFKWMFGKIPKFLMLHPYTRFGLFVVGLPLYIYLSPVLWGAGELLYAPGEWEKLLERIRPSSFMPVGFGSALFLYTAGLGVGMFVSFKMLRKRSGSKVKKQAGKKEETRKTQERKARSRRDELLEIARFFEGFRPGFLSDRVIGQDYALEEVAKGLSTSAKLLGLREKRGELVAKNLKRFRILSSMIFVGATGVGKTETAKALADLLKPYGYQFIRVDLNMYRDEQAVWTLLGSPRGYVGSDRGGELTGKLRRNPRAVILFDEMEKAHPDLHTAFMTLLDEGYLEDRSFGDKIYLELGIVIFTSNLYAGEIARLVQEEEKNPLELEVKLREFVERYFGRPELVGRVDRIVPFKDLSEDDLEKIVRKVIMKHDPGLAHYSYALVKALSDITERYGVRAMVRKVEEVVVEGEPAVKKLIESFPKKKKVRDWLLDVLEDFEDEGK